MTAPRPPTSSPLSLPLTVVTAGALATAAILVVVGRPVEVEVLWVERKTGSEQKGRRPAAAGVLCF